MPKSSSSGKYGQYLDRKKELEARLSQNDWSDSKELAELNREYARVSEIISLKEKFDSLVAAIQENEALLKDAQDDPELVCLIEEELPAQTEEANVLEKRLMQKMLPEEPNAGRAVIIEIRAGTGGEEASLFAGELFKAYQRFAELSKLSLEILESSSTGLGGLKEIIFSVKGQEAWSLFKYESGTHRVQRVPVTETSGRIHTSAVTVAIMAEAEDVDIHIEPKDLRIDTYRSSGPGGQSVNTMDSAIRITHIPSGVVVTCQDEKSQHKNKAKAMRILRARLLEKKQHEEMQKRSESRKNQVGSGDRSEKIRTYNFPQNRVTDHRINFSLYSLNEVMEGKMDLIYLALAEAEYKLYFDDEDE